MAYNWMAHHVVRRRFPELSKKLQDEIISEAICRAWCTFQAPDYRLMEACVTAAARRKGVFTPSAVQPDSTRPLDRKNPTAGISLRPVVIDMADYR